jgi:hypothetical protein
MTDQVLRVQLSTPAAPQAGPALTQTVISIGAVTPYTVTVNYQTLPGNQPFTYKNFVAIWQSTIIPWGAPPLKQQPIPGDGQSGSTTLSGLAVQEKPYIVGYGVGSNITNICASSVIYVGGQAGPSQSVIIGLASIASNSLVVHYQTLDGYLPMTNKNWVGLWQGTASPYYSGAPMAKAAPTQDVSDGYIALNNLSLPFGTTFTLVYFAGPKQTAAAAILTFTTSGATAAPDQED